MWLVPFCGHLPWSLQVIIYMVSYWYLSNRFKEPYWIDNSWFSDFNAFSCSTKFAKKKAKSED
jgi:steroid 5-alpha reductase family enzyme